MSNEQTVAQVLVGAGPDGMLPPKTLALGTSMSYDWWRKVRLMRRDPTIGFLRDMFSAPILSAEWSVSADHPKFDDAIEMIKESTLPFRDKFLEDAIRGLFDFGWQPFEVVKEQHDDGTFYVTKYKGLLQDLSTIIVDYHGRLVGVRNMSSYSFVNQWPVYLFRGDCLVLYRQAEGTNWYGEPLMRRVERPYDSWMECDDGARRFDNKVAGAHWVVYYPVGTTLYKGTQVDNAVIAQDILAALSASGKIAVPQIVSRAIDDLSRGLDPSTLGWRIELISANTQQSQFIDRAKYLDSLKSRGIGIPERATLEGQFGTKAEAEAHADFAIDNIEMFHRNILALLNQQTVNNLLELNKGPAYRDKVKVQASPLSDSKRAMIKNLYMQHFGSEGGSAEESDTLDWSAIRDQLDLPIRKNGALIHDGTSAVPKQGMVVGPEIRPASMNSSTGRPRQSRRQRYLAARN